MKTIVLAAGLSKRLGELTKEKPKCLLQVDGGTILERTVRVCIESGLHDIAVVTGHGAAHVDAELERLRKASLASGAKISSIYNSHYADINNCYSLLLGLGEQNESILVVNSDDLFDGRILARIVGEGRSELVVDNVKQLTKESMKVLIKGEKICRIGKWLDIKESVGEYIGLARINTDDIALLRSSLEYVVANEPNGFYENAFDIMFERTSIYPCYTDGLCWTEVDTVEDYLYAKSLVQKEILR